jgi:hypothetical protein
MKVCAWLESEKRLVSVPANTSCMSFFRGVTQAAFSDRSVGTVGSHLLLVH